MKKKSYNIAVFVRDQEYLDQIEQYLEKSYKNIENITITFISEHKLKSKHNLINLNSYYDEVNIDQSEKEFYDSLDTKYWKNKKVYKADPRYVRNIKNITWKDQYKLFYSCKKIYEEKSFDLILMGGAAYLFWIVPQLVALEKNLLSYKLFFFNYINPYYNGIRLWFCTNPFWDIDINSNYDFKWEKSKTKNHIKDFRKSIIEDDFNLDVVALSLREDFTPTKLKNIIKNILKSLLSKDNLGLKRLKSSIEARKNQKLYIDLDDLPEKFLLFPLNQTTDEQLLLRASEFADNYKNLVYVLENLSKDINLIVKEHPINPGMIEAKLIKKLMSDYKNVYFISPSIPLRKILRKSQGLITINSTSGLESLLINKNVLALGMGYYRNLNSVYTVDKHPVKDVLKSMAEEKSIIDPVEIDSLLEKILNQTFPEPGKYPNKKLELDKTMSEGFYYKIKHLKSQS